MKISESLEYKIIILAKISTSKDRYWKCLREKIIKHGLKFYIKDVMNQLQKLKPKQIIFNTLNRIGKLDHSDK